MGTTRTTGIKIAALQAQNSELRGLLTRIIAAGINWEFGGDLHQDVEATLDRHDAEPTHDCDGCGERRAGVDESLCVACKGKVRR